MSEISGGETLSEDDIRDTLRGCFDSTNPWKRPLDIVSLGLVESINVATDEEAPGAGIPGVPARLALRLQLIPVTHDEDANAMLLSQIDNLLAGQPALSRRTITLLSDPVWNPERISAELRRTLKLDGPFFSILNNR